MIHLEGKVVITGASSGIGAVSAKSLAARGAKIVAAARGQEALDQLITDGNSHPPHDNQRRRRAAATRSPATLKREDYPAMAQAYWSSAFTSSADAIWAVVRRFNGMPDWHPGDPKATGGLLVTWFAAR
ncbi:NAD(P)-dependent dehydrogenase (short-subunit alcohol dehydrogenase family) [Streptomyces africanus]|uniref:NAD(P)-dependent dehydrogenase (Short-subunit alcohol dehydrogenase family) n=1 Tax=Streptomyces africanus TaxID=231024 RepID=A0ABU0QEQ5_9ACTN|nr:SDR family NAD(P)-dependent oxidoreductase [Streptomyces africanus]MDQ0745883.1 NAD(P)-dependent dehydrogenase (short-subunit alcohol dehydrogenase family) [Streptomyces africanus]